MSVSHTEEERAFRENYRKVHGKGWKWFVWVENTLLGPMPQAWSDVAEQQAHHFVVLAKHPIDPETDTWLNLDQLAKKYPYGA